MVADRPIDDPASPVGMRTPRGLFRPRSAGLEPALRDVTERSLAQLRQGGRKVVMIEPIPISTVQHNPLNCLSSATNVDQCIYQANATRTPLENMYASEAEPGAVWSLDLDRLVCPRLPSCDPVLHGLIVKRDGDHITAKFAKVMGPGVDALLHQVGVLP